MIRKKTPVELRTGLEDLTQEELIRKVQNTERALFSKSSDLEKAYELIEDLTEKIESLNAIQSLSSMSGILNLRIVQEDEHLREISTRLIRNRLEFLLENLPTPRD